jgi:hypothetical protein
MAAAANAGVLVHWCGDNRYCHGRRGLPDLILAGSNGTMFAELKAEDGETSADQDLWLSTLHDSGTPYAVWRPGNWESGLIRARLRDLHR